MENARAVEFLMELFREEYLALLGYYEGFNDRSLLIKGWSVSIGAASILAVYLTKQDDRPGRLAVMLAACSVLPFLAVDAVFKAIQETYESRLEELEAAILLLSTCAVSKTCEAGVLGGLSARGALAPFQFMARWEDVTFTDVLGVLRHSTVWMPHFPIFVAGIGLAVFARPRGAPLQKGSQK